MAEEVIIPPDANIQLVQVTQLNIGWAINENMRRITAALKTKLLDNSTTPVTATASLGSLEDVGYPEADDHAVPLAFLLYYIASNL